MTTITVSNQKGGVGKSTLAVHLAFYLQQMGKRVLFVDVDPQGNSSSTLEQYIAPIKANQLFIEYCEPNFGTNGSGITLISGDAKLVAVEGAGKKYHIIANLFRDNLLRLCSDFDFCIIDTPPSLGTRMVSALNAADYVISPIELEDYNKQGIVQMLQTIYGVRENKDLNNSDLTFLGMIPNRFNPRSVIQQDAFKKLAASYHQHIIPARIGMRSSISEALMNKIPVWELKKSAARVAGKEIKHAFDYIYEQIGGVK